MKCLIVLLLQLSLNSSCLCQENDTGFNPIERRIRELQSAGTIFYGPSITPEASDYLRNHVGFRSLKKNYKCLGDRNLMITKSELKFIKKEFEKNKNFTLPDHLFYNSLVTKNDSIIQLIENLNRATTDSSYTKENPNPSILKWAFYFSQPIYFRNNTMVFYFLMYYRNSTGSTGFIVQRTNYKSFLDRCTIGIGDW